jgi:hypothetical protein
MRRDSLLSRPGSCPANGVHLRRPRDAPALLLNAWRSVASVIRPENFRILSRTGRRVRGFGCNNPKFQDARDYA